MRLRRVGAWGVVASWVAGALVACSSGHHGAATAVADLTKFGVHTSDLPKGWQPLQSSRGSGRQQQQLLACGHSGDTARHVVHQSSAAYQADPASPQITAVASQVERMQSRADVTADAATATSERVRSCYETVVGAQLAQSLKPGARVRSVRFTAAPVGHTYPANVVALNSGRAEVLSGGRMTIVYFDSASISGPGVEVHVDFTGYGHPTGKALERHVILLVAARASAA